MVKPDWSWLVSMLTSVDERNDRKTCVNIGFTFANAKSETKAFSSALLKHHGRNLKFSSFDRVVICYQHDTDAVNHTLCFLTHMDAEMQNHYLHLLLSDKIFCVAAANTSTPRPTPTSFSIVNNSFQFNNNSRLCGRSKLTAERCEEKLVILQSCYSSAKIRPQIKACRFIVSQ